MSIRWLKRATFLLCLLPIITLGWRGTHQGLGANPVEFITHSTGDWTLRFLLITLAVTPARSTLGVPTLIRFRRMFGLFAFFYGCLHFLTYIWLDKFFDLQDMLKDIGKRPFITIGFASLLDGSARGDVDGGLDPAAWRKALAAAASAYLLDRRRRRNPLLLAREIRRSFACSLRRNPGCPFGLSVGSFRHEAAPAPGTHAPGGSVRQVS